MSAPDQQQNALTLVGELVAATARDLKTWKTREDVNWVSAGRAALVSLDSSIGYLESIRADLVPALLADSPEHRARQVDTDRYDGIIESGSGPGF